MIAAVKVCEKRMPALVGNEALNVKFPFPVELLSMIDDSDEYSPFAVIVPLIRIDDWDHGWTVTKPSTSEIAIES